MDQKPLAGKTALVTGAARNIGRATALRLAASGANVIVNAVQDHAAAEAVKAEIEAMGGRAIAVLADVTDRDAVMAMAEAGRVAFGAIDILVCNASARGQTPSAMPRPGARRHSWRWTTQPGAGSSTSRSTAPSTWRRRCCRGWSSAAGAGW
jgi:NAD(P)-dependent dehydrogenase (short-subunit alcohol dehydrogenase family)